MPEIGSPEWDANLDDTISSLKMNVEIGKVIINHVEPWHSPNTFTYTIGLHRTGLPELRISQFHHQIAQEIIANLVEEIILTSGPDTDLVKNRSYEIDLYNEPATFTFDHPTIFEPERPIGLANRVFEKQVPVVNVVTEGWPCPRCTPLNPNESCTCRFSCWYNKCDRISEYQRNLPRSKYV